MVKHTEEESMPLVDYERKGRIASEMLITTDTISAQRAYEAGLINRIVPQEQLVPAATELAERICENSPLAIRAAAERQGYAPHRCHVSHRSCLKRHNE